MSVEDILYVHEKNNAWVICCNISAGVELLHKRAVQPEAAQKDTEGKVKDGFIMKMPVVDSITCPTVINTHHLHNFRRQFEMHNMTFTM